MERHNQTYSQRSLWGQKKVQVVERGSSIIKAILNKIFREKC